MTHVTTWTDLRNMGPACGSANYKGPARLPRRGDLFTWGPHLTSGQDSFSSENMCGCMTRAGGFGQRRINPVLP